MTTNKTTEFARTVQTADGVAVAKFSRAESVRQNTPRAVSDEDLENVAGGTTHAVHYSNCTHNVSDPNDDMSISDIFDTAAADHQANCV